MAGMILNAGEHALVLHGEQKPLASLLDALATGTAQDWLACAQGLVLRQEPRTALAVLQAAIEHHPDEPEVRLAHAGLLAQTGATERAECLLEALLARHPTHAGAGFLLANLLHGQGRTQAMAGMLRNVFTQTDVVDTELAIRAIELLAGCGRLVDALAICEVALDARPEDPRLHLHAGALAAQLGQFNSARDHHAFVLAHSKHALEWHVPLALAELQRYPDREHPDFSTFERLLQNSQLTAHARAGLLFALGKACDDIGEFAGAARYLNEANATVRAPGLWSRKAWKRRIESRLARRLPDIALATEPSWAPLFVVGMPRSGSTLLSELLSRHPDICLRGELPWLPTLASKLDTLSALYPDALQQAANRYGALLRQDDDASRKSRWFIDKQPYNYMEVDIILAMFPGARIIHCLRGARDNALSLWMQSFQPGTQDFAYDFGDIAAAIRCSRRLMEHWTKRYPEAIRTVRYEEVVREPASCLSSLLGWLGLPEQDLLQPTDSPCAISTASLWQVRQPIHDKSVGRWRNYQTYLPALVALLD